MNDSQWYYLDANNQQQGPVAGAQLQALAAQSQLTPTTQVWTEGLEEWIPANQVEGLFAVAPDTNTMTSQAAYQPPNSDPSFQTQIPASMINFHPSIGHWLL